MKCRICQIQFGHRAVDEMFTEPPCTIKAQFPCGCLPVMCLPCVMARSLIHAYTPSQLQEVDSMEARCYICWKRCALSKVVF